MMRATDVMADYLPDINEEDAGFLKLTDAGDADVLNTVTKLANGNIAADLKNPLVFNRHTGKGKQLLLVNAANYSDCHLLFYPQSAAVPGPFGPQPPSTTNLPLNQARELLQAGEQLAARKILDEALAQDPDSAAWLRFKVDFLFACFGHDECIPLAEQLLLASPDDLALLALLGNCFYFQPNHRRAEEIYRRILAISPHHELANARLSVLHSVNSSTDYSKLPFSDLAQALRKYAFYHVIPLAKHIPTPGCLGYQPIQGLVHGCLDTVDFKQRSVLDIGCRDGLFSFEAENRGAAQVLGIDNDLSKPATEFLIPFLKSKVTMRELNLFDLKPEVHGTFDIIIFAGVLYHLRYPFWALQVIRNVLKPDGILILETAIWQGQEDHAMLYCPVGKESPYEPTSVTFFNAKGLRDSLASLGFSISAVRSFPATHTGVRNSSIGPITRSCFVCHYGTAPIDQHTNEYWNHLHHDHVVRGPGKPTTVRFGAGFHPGQRNWRWMAEEGELLILDITEPSEVYFNLQCSAIEAYPKQPFAVSIYVNDQLASKVTFHSSKQTEPVSFRVLNPAANTRILIKSEAAMVPKEHGVNEDTKMLSVCLSGFGTQPLETVTG